jgi:hypothetical protein
LAAWPAIVVVVVFGAGVLLFVRSELRLVRRYGYRPRRLPPQAVPGHRFDPHHSSSVRVGARVGWVNATIPLVTLTVDRSWARLSGPIPVWIPRTQVTQIRAVPAFLSHAIQFRSTSGDLDGVVVWTHSGRRVLDLLASFGWPTAP